MSVKKIHAVPIFGLMTATRIDAPTERPVIDSIKNAGIDRIKTAHRNYDRKEAVSREPLSHYAAYYKKFKKTYHVLGQLESILLKGKGIPPIGAAIEAMFLAEVKNLLLTAGHDLDKIEGHLAIGVAAEAAIYQGISGREQQLVEGDLYLCDDAGVLSSILGGPDHRTRITGATQNILYFTYGVEGVTDTQIRSHLGDLAHYLREMIPGANTGPIEVYE